MTEGSTPLVARRRIPALVAGRSRHRRGVAASCRDCQGPAAVRIGVQEAGPLEGPGLVRAAHIAHAVAALRSHAVLLRSDLAVAESSVSRAAVMRGRRKVERVFGRTVSSARAHLRKAHGMMVAAIGKYVFDRQCGVATFRMVDMKTAARNRCSLLIGPCSSNRSFGSAEEYSLGLLFMGSGGGGGGVRGLALQRTDACDCPPNMDATPPITDPATPPVFWCCAVCPPW